jgi:hypothetical protein
VGRGDVIEPLPALGILGREIQSAARKFDAPPLTAE